MGLLITDEGKLALLAHKAEYLSTLYCHLYVNDIVPAVDDEEAMYFEAAFPGYLPQLLGIWGSPYLTAQGKARVDHAPVAFEQDAEPSTVETVYGYYLTTEAGGGTLIAAERSATGGFVMLHDGASVILSPNWTENTDQSGV